MLLEHEKQKASGTCHIENKEDISHLHGSAYLTSLKVQLINQTPTGTSKVRNIMVTVEND